MGPIVFSILAAACVATSLGVAPIPPDALRPDVRPIPPGVRPIFPGVPPIPPGVRPDFPGVPPISPGNPPIPPKPGKDRGFLLMAPRVLAKNATSTFYLSLYEGHAQGSVELSLLKKNNGTVLSYTSYTIPADTSNIPLKFYTPQTDEYEATLRVDGVFRNGYRLSGETDVYLRDSPSTLIFVQTDKPFYKPGQKVLFRVLALSPDLKPVAVDTMGDVWVEMPNGARVAQWLDTCLGSGINQYGFPLPPEPDLGQWTIYVSVGGNLQTQTFEVKTYVLPKFEVEIKTPSYVLATDKLVPIDVCAKYTYGKKVDGTLRLNVSKQTYSWQRDDLKKPIQRVNATLINGCFHYVINVTSIDETCCQNIEIFAEIVEKGTGNSQNVTKYVVRTQYPLNLSFRTKNDDFFKPGLPYYGELKVTLPDGKPAKSEPINICMSKSRERRIVSWFGTQEVKYCKNYTSNSKGIVSFTVPPLTVDTVRIDLEAKATRYPADDTITDYSKPRLYQPQAFYSLRSWYSPSGSQIQIQGKRELPCDEDNKIDILYTAKHGQSYHVYYQVIYKNKISKRKAVDVKFHKKDDVSDDCSAVDDITTGKRTMVVPDPGYRPFQWSSGSKDCEALDFSDYKPYIGKFNITVDVTPSLSPSFRLLVFYVRDDREVVADSREFEVEKCFQNQVSMEFEDDTKQPGTPTKLSIYASPYSLCGIRVVDKSVTLMDPDEPLTIEKVFQRLSSLDIGSYYPENHCNDKRQAGLPALKRPASYLPFPPRDELSSPYEDAITAFETAGYAVISDLILLTRPCKKTQYIGYPMPLGAPRVMFKGARGPSMEDSVGGSPPPATVSAVDVRSYFPDTWLFEMVNVGRDGEITLKETLPHTITEWVGNTVCVDRDDGLGLSETTTIKGFQAFFLSLTLPYSVIRGEKLPVIVSVFNYLKECLPISITLSKSKDFELVSGSYKIDTCLCGGDKKDFKFYTKPRTVGQVNFTVSGVKMNSSSICGSSKVSKLPARDALTDSVQVMPEGFPYEKVTTYFFFPEEKLFGVYYENIEYECPETAVEGSERGFFAATGDIMSISIQNIKNLLRLPTGCGEQNIVKFLPNVYALDYLKAIGELTDQVKEQGERNLEAGYQSQLKYRRPDFSFSSFGNVDEEGSMFLTAFVVRAFAEASKYISIDKSDLQRSRDWILSKQQKDGCFPPIGDVFSSAIQGSVEKNETSSITAYVLMSLLTADMAPDDIFDKAAACIESDYLLNPFQQALFAYTYALAGKKSEAEDYLRNLYYTADDFGDTTQWNYGPLTTQIEIASYAVLTSIKLGKPVSKILPIVRFLNKNRNSYGGFLSTQDTIIGIKALSEFAPLISGKPVNLTITTSNALEKTIKINKDNRQLLRTYQLDEVPGDVSVVAKGTGGGMIQATMRCNTNQLYEDEYFELDITTSKDSCDIRTVTVCTKYIPYGKKSNMAVMEINMPSGMLPVRDTLEQLKNSPTLGLRRFEVGNNNLVMYFEQITNKRTCFSFKIEVVVRVNDLKPARAQVYDYYAPEYDQKEFYTVKQC